MTRRDLYTNKEVIEKLKNAWGRPGAVEILSSSAYCLNVKITLSRQFGLTYQPYEQEVYVCLLADGMAALTRMFHTLDDAIAYINKKIQQTHE